MGDSHPVSEAQLGNGVFPVLDLKGFDLGRQILLKPLLLSHFDYALAQHICNLPLDCISLSVDDHPDIPRFSSIVDEIIDLLQQGIRVQFYLEIFTIIFVVVGYTRF